MLIIKAMYLINLHFWTYLNLCSRQSLCDIGEIAVERDIDQDAQRVCQAELSLVSPLAGTKQMRCVKLAANNVL